MREAPTSPQTPVTSAHSRERVIGTYTTGRPGPTVVVTAAIHGNEPAGTYALQRVFATLGDRSVPLRGKLMGLVGNIEAFDRGVRFIDRDLNRGWSAKRVAELLRREQDDSEGEDREQRELGRLFLGVFAEARDPVYFLDLHSTSAGGSPFCAISDTLRNRRLAFSLPVPVILGLEESIDGTMLSYLDDLGHVAVVFEGGQHADPHTVENHEAAVWITLVAAGALAEAHVPDYAEHVERLKAVARDIPHVVEIRYRHPVAADDGFVMRPGYMNFQPVERDEVLASDRTGDVAVHEDSARILMPLYQKQGEDGYFLVREVRRFWLRVSWLIRRLRLHVLLPVLPGVAWHEHRPDTLVVDPKVARYFVVEVFHLFGFRRAGHEGDRLIFSRRRPDFRRLARIELDRTEPS